MIFENRYKTNSKHFRFCVCRLTKSQYANYLMNIFDMLSTKSILVCDDVIKYKTKMSWLYEFLEKKQIIYDEIDTEEWDGVLFIKSE